MGLTAILTSISEFRRQLQALLLPTDSTILMVKIGCQFVVGCEDGREMIVWWIL